MNLALAEVVDGVVLVVAGHPVWLKGALAPVATTPVGPDEAGGFTVPGVPMPDEAARTAATAHLAALGPVGLGGLAEVVRFAAGTQGVPVPRPWTDCVLVCRETTRGAGGGRPRLRHPRPAGRYLLWPGSPRGPGMGWFTGRPRR